MPKVFSALLLILLCFAPLAGYAATPDDSYLAAADAAMKNPDSADWSSLRQLYTGTSFYKQLDAQGAVPALPPAADKALANTADAAAMETVKKLLRQHLADIDSHFYALHLVAENHAGFIDEAFERKAAKGLLSAILKTGDGQSPATAYHTIGTDEDVAVIKAYYNFAIKARNAGQDSAGAYTVYDVEDAKSGKAAKMYFRAGFALPGADALTAAGAPKPLEEAEVNKFRALAAQQAPSPKDAPYLDLVDKAMAQPDKADWHSLRDMYVDTSFYRQQGGLMPAQLFGDAIASAEKDPGDAAVAHLKTLLRQHFGNIASHYQAMKALGKNPELKKWLDPALETAAAKGLLTDILSSGDGRSLKTAFKTITLNEQQYVATEVIKKPVENMNLEMHEGHIYNIVHLRDPKTDELQDVYFLNDDRMTQQSLMPKGATVSALPQEAPPPLTKADQEYLDLVDRAMEQPRKAQWAKIRELYPDTSFYKRIGGASLDSDCADVIKQAAAAHSDRANLALKAYLRENFGSVGSHLRAAKYAIDTKAQVIDRDFELLAYAELIRVVSRTGDGTSLATPFIVISPEEESYFLASFFNTQDAKPQFRKDNGVLYSVVSVTQPDTKKKLDVYFVFDSRMTQHP